MGAVVRATVGAATKMITADQYMAVSRNGESVGRLQEPSL